MLAKFIFFVTLLNTLVFGQFPPPVMQENTPIDSSDILADMILKSKTPVLIDFWAPWCMPCRMLGPIIEEMKKKYAGKIKVIKINVDASRKISAYFRISSIPAVFFVKDKAVVLHIPGLRTKEDYEKAIKEVLAMKTAPADTSAQKQPVQNPASPAPK
jgi:thioredoxin 1